MQQRFLSRRRAIGLTLNSGLGALASWALPAWAAPAASTPANWPGQQLVKIIVPDTHGLADNMLRVFLAQRLGAALGTVVEVEDAGLAHQDYLAGAVPGVIVQKDRYRAPEGLIGLVKAAPDGHTLAFADASSLAVDFYSGQTPYDPAKDFMPVASLFASPVLLLATPALPQQDVPDFAALLARARQKPGAIRCATSGLVSLGHLILGQVNAVAGVDMAHVPYPMGDAPLVAEAVAGKFELLAIPAGPVVFPQIKAGRLRPLAVSAPARLKKELANVPTLTELNLSSANLSAVFGFFAPVGTPAQIVQKLNQVIDAQSRDAEVEHHLDAEGLVAVEGSAADFRRLITETASNIHAALRVAKYNRTDGPIS